VEILKADLERTLRLLGCPSVRELDSSFIDAPGNWHSV
jgi:isopentenyl diphosphate isomerase/L-lactate dehydrogenase-like FMN-dependent dehydrogenase